MREIRIFRVHAELRVRHLDKGLGGQSSRQDKGYGYESEHHGFK
jgi:hypothetical protein